MATLAQEWPNLTRKIMGVGVESKLVNYVSIFFYYISSISIGADHHCKQQAASGEGDFLYSCVRVRKSESYLVR
jgi:hypothetical protein